MTFQCPVCEKPMEENTGIREWSCTCGYRFLTDADGLPRWSSRLRMKRLLPHLVEEDETLIDVADSAYVEVERRQAVMRQFHRSITVRVDGTGRRTGSARTAAEKAYVEAMGKPTQEYEPRIYQIFMPDHANKKDLQKV